MVQCAGYVKDPRTRAIRRCGRRFGLENGVCQHHQSQCHRNKLRNEPSPLCKTKYALCWAGQDPEHRVSHLLSKIDALHNGCNDDTRLSGKQDASRERACSFGSQHLELRSARPTSYSLDFDGHDIDFEFPRDCAANENENDKASTCWEKKLEGDTGTSDLEKVLNKVKNLRVGQ